MISSHLITSCINGERKAHRECYEVCAPYLYNIIKSYIKDEELRKDALQESFANIFKAMHRFDSNKASFKTWITRITINQTIMVLRKNKVLNLWVPIENVNQVANLDQDLLTSLSKKDINKLLEQMPRGYKTIFMLYVIDEYKHKEIASMLNISPQTSRSQLFRAINWVRNNLNKSTKNFIYG